MEFYLLVCFFLLGIFLSFFCRWFFAPIIDSWMDLPAIEYKHAIIQQINNQKFNEDNSSSSKSNSNSGNNNSLIPFPQSLLFTDEIWNQQGNRVYLSCIIPAYNEEERIDVMMEETIQYCLEREKKEKSNKNSNENNPPFTFELIFVDDGSKDGTSNKILSYQSQYGLNRVRLLKLKKNLGKGGAVQQGMLHARGEILLMVDADGATKFKDLELLEQGLRDIINENKKNSNNNSSVAVSSSSFFSSHLGISVGSRKHLQSNAIAKRAWYRNILMFGFHFLVSTLTGIKNIQDTQCGFKLFTRKAAQFLFVNQHLRRWCFDVDLLFLSTNDEKIIPVNEISVNWEEIPGSKINLLESCFLMARDLIVLRFAYTIGIWKYKKSKVIKEKLMHEKEAEVNKQFFNDQGTKSWQNK